MDWFLILSEGASTKRLARTWGGIIPVAIPGAVMDSRSINQSSRQSIGGLTAFSRSMWVWTLLHGRMEAHHGALERKMVGGGGVPGESRTKCPSSVRWWAFPFPCPPSYPSHPPILPGLPPAEAPKLRGCNRRSLHVCGIWRVRRWAAAIAATGPKRRLPCWTLFGTARRRCRTLVTSAPGPGEKPRHGSI